MFLSVDAVLTNAVVGRNLNVEIESLMRTWPDWWPTCRRGWSGQRSGHIYCMIFAVIRRYDLFLLLLITRLGTMELKEEDLNK